MRIGLARHIVRVGLAVLGAGMALGAGASHAMDWGALGTQLLQPVAIDSQLPNSSIPNTLASDESGFLWVGTQNGLARWDGLKFHIYGSGPGGLPDSQVETLHLDRAKRLWVGTHSAGVALYDSRTARFRAFAVGKGGLSHAGVNAIADAPGGQLWVGTDGGLDELDPRTGRGNAVLEPSQAPSSMMAALASGVTALAQDKASLWIGTEQGLLRRDLQSGRISSVPLTRQEAKVKAILRDAAGRIWVGTDGAGAYVIAPGAVLARPVPGSLHKGVRGTGMRVRALMEVSPGRIWLGTYDDGVVEVDASTLTSLQVRLGSGSLLYGDQNIRALHRAPGGQVFIASNSAITRYDPGHPAFTTLLGGQASTAVLGDRSPLSLLSDNQRQLWIGTISHGVDRIDLQSEHVEHLTPTTSGLPQAPVRAFAEFGPAMFAGTDGGLYRFAVKGEQARRVLQPDRAADAPVSALLVDGPRLWVGARDGLRAYRLDGSGRLTRDLQVNSGLLTDRRVEGLMLDRRHRLWIATDNGLNVLDVNTGIVARLEPGPNDQTTPRGFISSISQDREGRLWVTTFGHGVSFAASPEAAENRRFSRLDTAQGMPNSNTNKALEDQTGSIWISTDAGLARLDHAGGHVEVFQQAQGEPVASFFLNAGVTTTGGELVFAGREGLVVVQPDRLRHLTAVPPLRLTEVRVAGRDVAADSFLALGSGEPLRLPPGGGGLEISFAALDYAAPEQIKYGYRLLGLSDLWTEVDSSRRIAAFSNLSPGRYQLEIRAINPSGAWPPRLLRLPILVQPAWSQTWWFCLLEVVLSVLLVVALIRWRTGHLQGRRLELEALVEERTRALQAQKDVLELQAVELAEARMRAEANDKAKSDFLANMSHEIRTPLNGVVAVADMLARSSLPAKERGMAEIIRASGDTLQRLLSDILDMARIESGKIALEVAPFHLGDMLRAVAGLWQMKCDEKGVALRLDIDPDVECMVTGDMVRVRQVVTNLLSNAVKFTDAGEVRLKACRTEGGGFRMEVSDTGLGFDMVDKAKVLGRFEQADSSITRRFGGTGLGLSICCSLAELMGGGLDCDSRPGEGARFWLELPLEEGLDQSALATNQAQESAALEDSVEEGSSLRVLLADDHPTNRQVVQLMLDGSSIELTIAENGLEAVESYRRAGFDLILMDMQMPVMDGLTALRQIRRLELEGARDRIPAIMLTANALPEHVASALQAGADLHLTKPFTAQTLFAAMEAALSGADEQEEVDQAA